MQVTHLNTELTYAQACAREAVLELERTRSDKEKLEIALNKAEYLLDAKTQEVCTSP